MSIVEDQIRTYTEQIDDNQMAVSVAEALALVDTVRVSDSGTPVSVERRWQGLLVAGAVGVAVVVLIGSAFLIGSTEDDPSIDVATASSTPTTLPVSSESTETHLGTWTWERSQLSIDSKIVAFDGRFYATESDPVWDENFEPVPSEERRQNSWLLTSADGIVWDRQKLPDEMSGIYISLGRQNDDALTLWGWSGEGEDLSAWASVDGMVWTQTDVNPWGGTDSLALTVPAVETQGVEMHVISDDPVLAGKTRLVRGTVSFDFPDFVQELFAEGYANNGPLGADRGTFEGFSFVNSVVYQVDYVIEGSAIEYTFWEGRRDQGQLLHTARIDLGSVDLMNRLPRDGLLSPSFSLLWRSPPNGGPFEIVRDPFITDDPSTARYRTGTQMITSVDGGFVLYGATSGGPTTRLNEFVTRNEPSEVGAVATSTDGLAWSVDPISELVFPGSITFMSNGLTVWDGQGNVWVSEDGVSGEVLDLPGSEWESIMGWEDLLVTGASANRIQISADARTWSPVAVPQVNTRDWRIGFAFEDGRLFYTVASPNGGATTWVGHLDQ